jgi:hypothetical protein
MAMGGGQVGSETGRSPAARQTVVEAPASNLHRPESGPRHRIVRRERGGADKSRFGLRQAPKVAQGVAQAAPCVSVIGVACGLQTSGPFRRFVAAGRSLVRQILGRCQSSAGLPAVTLRSRRRRPSERSHADPG